MPPKPGKNKKVLPMTRPFSEYKPKYNFRD